MNEDILDFEDIFEIVTPSDIDRRIHDLDAAWLQLLSDSNNDAYVKAEHSKWDVWAKDVLSSYFNKFFASGVLKELDKWQARYKLAYDRISGNKLAPAPDVFKNKDSIFASPFFWGTIGVLTVLGIYIYAKKSK
jgi:hypothetical protein